VSGLASARDVSAAALVSKYYLAGLSFDIPELGEEIRKARAEHRERVLAEKKAAAKAKKAKESASKTAPTVSGISEGIASATIEEASGGYQPQFPQESAPQKGAARGSKPKSSGKGPA
jgi:hypothetical protein